MSTVLRNPNSVPSFRGKHNLVKRGTWLVLEQRYIEGEKGLTLKELASVTGFSYKSLSTLLSRWVKWGYIGCHYQNSSKGRRYYLKKRGRSWLERWWDIMPARAVIERSNNAP